MAAKVIPLRACHRINEKQAAEIADCEKALGTLLDELIRQRTLADNRRERRRAKGEAPRPPRMYNFNEFMELPDLSDLYTSPIDAAFKRSIRTIGKRLFELLGNTDAMLDICERVASKGRGGSGYRGNIIDQTWDGIGNESDMWFS